MSQIHVDGFGAFKIFCLFKIIQVSKSSNIPRANSRLEPIAYAKYITLILGFTEELDSQCLANYLRHSG